LISSILDECLLISFSFFLFALAGLEFALGFMLIILFKNYNLHIDFIQSNDQISNKNFNYNDRYILKKK